MGFVAMGAVEVEAGNHLAGHFLRGFQHNDLSLDDI